MQLKTTEQYITTIFTHKILSHSTGCWYKVDTIFAWVDILFLGILEFFVLLCLYFFIKMCYGLTSLSCKHLVLQMVLEECRHLSQNVEYASKTFLAWGMSTVQYLNGYHILFPLWFNKGGQCFNFTFTPTHERVTVLL